MIRKGVVGGCGSLAVTANAVSVALGSSAPAGGDLFRGLAGCFWGVADIRDTGALGAVAPSF